MSVRRRITAPVIAAGLLLAASTVAAQTPADVADATALVNEVFTLVSGPAGDRDWDRLGALFVPGAAMLGVRRDPKSGLRVNTQSFERWRDGARTYFRANAFYERPVDRQITRQGDLVHVRLILESRYTPDGAPFQRSTAAMALVRDGGQLKILSWTTLEEVELKPAPQSTRSP